MNNFSIIGKFCKYKNIDNNNIIIYVQTDTPLNNMNVLEIITTNHKFISKIEPNDLLGIHGFIKKNAINYELIATKIIWLSQKK